jgi:hypothetical protein
MRMVCIAAAVVSIVFTAAAQRLEIGIDGGYGLPAGTVLAGHRTVIDTTTYTAKTFEEVYSAAGNGWKMTGQAVWYPFENAGLIAIAGFSTRNRYDTVSMLESGNNKFADTVTTTHIPLNIGVKIKAKIGIVEPYVYVAPGVIFPAKSESSYDSTSASAVTVKKTYSFAPGFSVTAGLGVAVMVTPKIGIKTEFSPTYASASPTGYEEVKKDSYGTTTTTYKYKDNTPPSQLKPDELQSRPHDSFSSMAFKAGVYFNLF